MRLSELLGLTWGEVDLAEGLLYVRYQLSRSRIEEAVRGGAWFDPDHAVRYEPTAANDSLDVLLKATLPGGENLVHYSFGGGIAATNRLELNAAADISTRTTYLTASAVFRF